MIPKDLKNYRPDDTDKIRNHIIALGGVVMLILLLAWMDERDRQDYEGLISTHMQCEQAQEPAKEKQWKS